MNRLRKQAQRNARARRVLAALEKHLKHNIRFVYGESEWDPNSSTVSVGRARLNLVARFLNGGDWQGRIVFHELGHAVLDTFWHKFDQASFRKIYQGSPKRIYPANAMLQAFKGTLDNRTAVTRYGKSHPHEAWAESFSLVIQNVEDRDLSSDKIRQLAYVDWVIKKIEKSKKRWASIGTIQQMWNVLNVANRSR